MPRSGKEWLRAGSPACTEKAHLDPNGKYVYKLTFGFSVIRVGVGIVSDVSTRTPSRVACRAMFLKRGGRLDGDIPQVWLLGDLG